MYAVLCSTLHVLPKAARDREMASAALMEPREASPGAARSSAQHMWGCQQRRLRWRLQRGAAQEETMVSAVRAEDSEAACGLALLAAPRALA